MKKNLLLIFLLLFVLVNFTACKNNKKEDKDNNESASKIDDDYMFFFVGGNEKITYKTYIYKIDNNQANYGFRYINTTTKEDKEEIVGTGNLSWTDDVFIAAKKHGAYSYVQYNGKDKQYTIDEVAKNFLMN